MNKWRLLLLSVLGLLQSASAERNLSDGRDPYLADNRLFLQDSYRISNSPHGLRQVNAPGELNYDARNDVLNRAPVIRHFKHREFHWRPVVHNNEPLLSDHRKITEAARVRVYADSDRRDNRQRPNVHAVATRVNENRNRIIKENEDRDYSEISTVSGRDTKGKSAIRFHIAEASQRNDIILKNYDDRRVSNIDRSIKARFINSVDVRNGRDLDENKFVSESRRQLKNFSSRENVDNTEGLNRNPKTIRTTGTRYRINTENDEQCSYRKPFIGERVREVRNADRTRTDRRTSAGLVTESKLERDSKPNRSQMLFNSGRVSNDFERAKNARDEIILNKIRESRNYREEREIDKIPTSRNAPLERATNEIRRTRNAREQRASIEIQYTKNIREQTATDKIRYTRYPREESVANEIQQKHNNPSERYRALYREIMEIYELRIPRTVREKRILTRQRETSLTKDRRTKERSTEEATDLRRGISNRVIQEREYQIIRKIREDRVNKLREILEHNIKITRRGDHQTSSTEVIIRERVSNDRNVRKLNLRNTQRAKPLMKESGISTHRTYFYTGYIKNTPEIRHDISRTLYSSQRVTNLSTQERLLNTQRAISLIRDSTSDQNVNTRAAYYTESIRQERSQSLSAEEEKHKFQHVKKSRESNIREIRANDYRSTLEERQTDDVRHTRYTRDERGTNEILYNRIVGEERETNHMRLARHTRDETGTNEIRHNRIVGEERETNHMRLARHTREERATNKIRHNRLVGEERETNHMRLARHTREERATNEIRHNRLVGEERVTNHMRLARHTREERATNEIRHNKIVGEERETNHMPLARHTREERATNNVHHNRVVGQERETNCVRLARFNREERATNEIRHTRNAREERATDEIRLAGNACEDRATNEVRFGRNSGGTRVTNEIRISQNAREDRVTNDIRKIRNAREDRIANEVRFSRYFREDRVTNEVRLSRNARTQKVKNEIRLIRYAREDREMHESQPTRNADENRRIDEIRFTENTYKEKAMNEIRLTGNAREERPTKEIRGTGNAREEKTIDFQRSRNTLEPKSLNIIRNNINARDERLSDKNQITRKGQGEIISNDDTRRVKRDRQHATRIQKITRSIGERVAHDQQHNRNMRRMSLFMEEARLMVKLPANLMPAFNTEMESTFVLKWQYLFYLLQAIYLCSIFMKMPKKYEGNKTRAADNWYTVNYLKID